MDETTVSTGSITASAASSAADVVVVRVDSSISMIASSFSFERRRAVLVV